MEKPDTPGTEPTDSPHRGWHSRGYIPHFDHPGLVQGITFRLADSLPAHVRATMAEELKNDDSGARRAHVQAALDAGYDACHLRDPRIAHLVKEALLHFDGVRYRLIAWVIMPNHVHVLIETFEGFPLSDIVSSWKSYTAKEANRILGRTGRFWFREYFDRHIRDRPHYENTVEYIHNNPVDAGLTEAPEDWPFSSAECYHDLEGRQTDKPGNR